MSASRPVNAPSEPPTPEAALPRRRRPRKLNREPVSRRPESAGGVALPSTSPSPPLPTPTPPTESPALLPTTPTPRRQPRKLNRPAAAAQCPSPSGPEPTQSQQQSNGGVPADDELEALKNRVKELEAQVQELYTRPVVPKPPRKRGQGRKKQEAEELQRLQEELEAARKELEAVRLVGHGTPKGTSKSKADEPAQGESQQPGAVAEAREDEESDDDAETILRSSPPAISPQSDREATLSGSYSVRLPPSLSMNDVRAIQNGVTSAGNIARTLAAEYNAWQTTQSADRGSWSQWFGSCSASIARIANEVQGEAFVEWKARQQSGGEVHEAATPMDTSRALVGTRNIAANSAARRPALKARTSTSTTTSSVLEALLK
ncbi:hypothetical protein W97_07662 [Coniosporium apollinis CBS 100218]|uniref:Uncharacterized protein n=1 Tax=Coniosporium apollinis (strain CBS 100218) TaxID=1168221 RepID=R7Z2R1_CONA1|nr:uncharacterized protein W97_07662 [Coniosporium apollinis CBS 100218]EON68452.1 hypothetical protein W97_07662 [Coniosporium apollinis CBS 100218]